MTWYVKSKRPDGAVRQIQCDDPQQVKSNYDDQAGSGFETWIEDHEGKKIDEAVFGA